VEADSNDLATQASFALNVEQSSVSPLGKSDLQTQSAFVEYTNEFFAGTVNALKIQFFTRPISADDQAMLLRGETDELRRPSYAALVLLLDSGNQISQVNLTYVIPGTTVARTVASTPDELTKHFAGFHFDQKRLQLKSEGAYNTGETEDEVLSMSWRMDLDLPVFDQRKQ